jgi:hypothetical protein
VAQTSDIAALRSRLTPHGYHVFLQPERPSGWLVILTGGNYPVTARAASRAAAVEVAERLFVHHRLSDLDTAIRDRGLVPPPWDGTQDSHLDALAAFAREHGVAA